MVQLGALLYALLEAIDGERDLDELAAALSERLGRGSSAEHVVALAEKLAAQGLLAGTEDKRAAAAQPAARAALEGPRHRPAGHDGAHAAVRAPLPPLGPHPGAPRLRRRLWFVLVQKGVASATAQAFDRPGLLLLVLGLRSPRRASTSSATPRPAATAAATPGGMGVGLYLVWPAFYTDVTDAYRLPRRDRLRVDLGGLYFNALVAVVTMGVWLLTGVDALLLLVALQVIEMVKQLSPVIRADGYHILSDPTGVPDLFAHIGPTLASSCCRARREPSALHGRARAIVTLWVLIVVPSCSAWRSARSCCCRAARRLGVGVRHRASASATRRRSDVIGVLASVAAPVRARAAGRSASR